ncbi:MAG: ZIP family metal transporter [Bacteroidales bacterium]|nr:ZIP family metal transporter [Bacteroidales bacterium]
MSQFLIIVILIFIGQTVGATLGLIGKPQPKVLLGSLAFAAAMMISLSLFELVPAALEFTSRPFVMISFFVGVIIMLAVDRILPHINPELMKKEKPSVKRSVAMLVIGIALHNIPEGLAIGIGFKVAPISGIVIATGIALQDIPENIATIIPLYALTGKRLKSFLIMFSTVLFEFVGFLIGYFALKGVPEEFLGMALAAAAGFMTYISVEELLPASDMKNNPKPAIIGFVTGTLAVLLLLFLE